VNIVNFENNGLIDKRAITVMGVSSKSGGAIGYFGTGLKYAISTILRNGMTITIYRGLEKLEFTKQKEKIRDHEFDIILMNGQALGFTTQLGRNWETWQAFRELYSNCIDENGKIFEGDAYPEDLTTLIRVEGEEFFKQYTLKDNIFISPSQVPDEIFNSCEVYFNSTGIFYRKVRVKDKVKLLFRYNILSNIDLTEDRTAKYDFQIAWVIRDAACLSNNKWFIEKMVTKNQGYFEDQIEFCGAGKPSI